MARLLVVEDDLNTNEAVTEYLREMGHTVDTAMDGEAALELFTAQTYDLILLDIMLPKVTGLAVLHTIRQTSEVPVMMLTAIGDEYTQVQSFDERADDYVMKPFSMVVLGKRIEALLRRGVPEQNADIVAFGDVKVDFDGYAAEDANGRIDVTPREIDLLRLLVRNPGHVLTRNHILDALWGDDEPILDRTIDTYIKNLRKKLRLTCITTVKGIGYKYEVMP